MKQRKLLFSLFTLLVLGVASAIALLPNTESKSDFSVETEKKDKKGIAKAVEFYHRLKANPVTGKIEVDKLVEAREYVKTIRATKALGLEWSEMGPSNVAGRVRALLVDKNDPSVIYAGGVGGGLWKSTTGGQSWKQVSLDGNIAVSCMTQAPNGDIYVGTGEGFVVNTRHPNNQDNQNSGSYGNGVYYKAAASDKFEHLPETSSWKIVYRLAADKNGKIYAATVGSLSTTADNGKTWERQRLGTFNDVKTTHNGTGVVASTGDGKVHLSADGITWSLSTLPSANLARTELAISPSNPEYIYAVLVASNGSLYGIYRSTDSGQNWVEIAEGGNPSFNLFGPNNQGWYDNVIMVHLTNPDIVYVGGIDMWKGEKYGSGDDFSWRRKSIWAADDFSSLYAHADHHVYAHHPTDPNTFFLGTDGGVFKTMDGGNTFTTHNKNFNVTQFYAVTSHPNGGAFGGTQDNGTQFVDLQGNNIMDARELRGGDGGWSAASMLNQEVMFASVYEGNVGRSSDDGKTFQNPVDPQTKEPDFYMPFMMDTLEDPSATSPGKYETVGAFVTPVILWETTSFENNTDSVEFFALQDYSVNDTIVGRSELNNEYPFEHVLQQDISMGDTIKIMDPIQSRLFVGVRNGVFMTKQSLYFGQQTPEWFQISANRHADEGRDVWHIQVSKDGDVLYYAVDQYLYRLSNLLSAQDSASANVGGSKYAVHDTLLGTFDGIITSISIDYLDANKVIVTVGGVNNDHVYYSSNATATDASFEAKKGNLTSSLPVYASLIPMHNSKTVIIGTEYGMYVTEDITANPPTWSQANAGIDAGVAVYMLHQQQKSLPYTSFTYPGGGKTDVYPGVENFGQILAATHGRGIFTCRNYMSVEDRKYSKFAELSNMKLYPNPVVNRVNFEYTLDQAADVFVNIYDISGRSIRTYNLGKKMAGEQRADLNLQDLPVGTYVLQIQAEGKSLTKKFIKN